MLELTDAIVQQVIYAQYGSLLNLNNDEKDIVYALEPWALRLRTELLGENQTKVLPFASYYQIGYEDSPRRYERALAIKGIPVISSTEGFKTYKFNPVLMTYQILFWSKDNLEINKIKRQYIRALRRTNYVQVVFKSGYSVRLSYEYGKLSPIARVPRESYPDQGLMFNAEFNLEVDSWISLGEPVDKKTIQHVIFNIFIGDTENNILEKTIQIDY